MAKIVVNIASINWNAATWTTDAGGAQGTNSAYTDVTETAWQFSASTTTTASTALYVVMYLNALGATGTLDVCVSTDGVNPAQSAQVNLSDLPQPITGASAAQSASYVVFKLGGTFAAGNYYLGVKCSAGSSGVRVFRNATAKHWYRTYLTSATSSSVAAGDYPLIGGLLGPTTSDVAINTVTVNGDYSGTETSWITVGHKGIMTYQTGGSSIIQLAGGLNVFNGGILKMGASGAAIGAAYTAKLIFNCASVVQYGLNIYPGGTLNTKGAERTAGKTVVSTYLTADSAANDTTLTVNDDTGWKDNDVIAIASTSSNYAECEGPGFPATGTGAMNGDATADTITIDGFTGTSGGLKYAHTGTSPAQAEVILLTRNVVITEYDASSSYAAYVRCYVGSTISCEWTEFSWMGYNSAGYYGVDVQCTGAVFDYCSFHHFDVTGGTGLYIEKDATISNCTFFACYQAINAFTATAATPISDCVAIYSGTASSVGFYLYNSTSGYATLADSKAAGFRTIGIQSSGTISNCISHSNTTYGFQLDRADQSVSDITAYYNSSYGVYINANVGIDTATLLGNTTANIYIAVATLISKSFLDITMDSSVAVATSYAISSNATSILDVYFNDCIIGTTTAHATALFNCANVSTAKYEIVFSDCDIGDTTIINNQTNLGATSFIGFSKFDQDDDYRTYTKYGLLQKDTTVYNTDAPSLKMTPLASAILKCDTFQINLNDGDTLTPSIYVRKSATYNGSQPLLRVKANPSLGIDDDTTLATAEAAAEAWEELTGTTAAVSGDGTLEFYIQITGDGTPAGYINVDDLTTD